MDEPPLVPAGVCRWAGQRFIRGGGIPESISSGRRSFQTLKVIIKAVNTHRGVKG